MTRPTARPMMDGPDLDLEASFTGIPKELDILPPRPVMFPILKACFSFCRPLSQPPTSLPKPSPPSSSLERRGCCDRSGSTKDLWTVKLTQKEMDDSQEVLSSRHVSTRRRRRDNRASTKARQSSSKDESSVPPDDNSSYNSIPDLTQTSFHDDDEEDFRIVIGMTPEESADSHGAEQRRRQDDNNTNNNSTPGQQFSPTAKAREVLDVANPRQMIHHATQLFLGVCQLLLAMVMADRALTALHNCRNRNDYHNHISRNKNKQPTMTK